MDKHYRPSAAASERGQPRRYAVEKQASSDYAGRFGSSADAGSRRPTGSYRSQPTGSYRSRMSYEVDRRATGTHSGDSYTRRPERKATTAEQTSSSRPDRRDRNKRGEGKHVASRVILALAALLAVAAILLLLGGGNKTVHQLPTVERAALLQEAVKAV